MDIVIMDGLILITVITGDLIIITITIIHITAHTTAGIIMVIMMAIIRQGQDITGLILTQEVTGVMEEERRITAGQLILLQEGHIALQEPNRTIVHRQEGVTLPVLLLQGKVIVLLLPEGHIVIVQELQDLRGIAVENRREGVIAEILPVLRKEAIQTAMEVPDLPARDQQQGHRHEIAIVAVQTGLIQVHLLAQEANLIVEAVAQENLQATVAGAVQEDLIAAVPRENPEVQRVIVVVLEEAIVVEVAVQAGLLQDQEVVGEEDRNILM